MLFGRIRCASYASVAVAVIFLAGVVVGVVVADERGPRSLAAGSPSIGDDVRPVAGFEADVTAPGLTVESPAPSLRRHEPAIDQMLAPAVTVRVDGRYGAGVLVDETGHVLTALHVVEDAGEARIRFHDGRWQPARVVAVAREVDLALLHVDAANRSPAEPASALDMIAGDTLYAVGNPRDFGFSLGRGVVSYSGRAMHGRRYLQTDLPANPGSSGGPVYDERGRLVGIMSFVLRNSEGIAFALPIDYAFDEFGDRLSSGQIDLQAFRAWTGDRAVGGAAAAAANTPPR